MTVFQCLSSRTDSYFSKSSNVTKLIFESETKRTKKSMRKDQHLRNQKNFYLNN